MPASASRASLVASHSDKPLPMKKLGDNLYKLWNRMSSGSYVPPPVKAVPIPKKSGGVRILGIPTVVDRIAQTTVKMWLEPRLDPIQENRRWRQSPLPDVASGTMTGLWSSTSEGCSTISLMTSWWRLCASTVRSRGSCSTWNAGWKRRCKPRTGRSWNATKARHDLLLPRSSGSRSLAPRRPPSCLPRVVLACRL